MGDVPHRDSQLSAGSLHALVGVPALDRVGSCRVRFELVGESACIRILIVHIPAYVLGGIGYIHRRAGGFFHSNQADDRISQHDFHGAGISQQVQLEVTLHFHLYLGGYGISPRVTYAGGDGMPSRCKLSKIAREEIAVCNHPVVHTPGDEILFPAENLQTAQNVGVRGNPLTVLRACDGNIQRFVDRNGFFDQFDGSVDVGRANSQEMIARWQRSNGIGSICRHAFFLIYVSIYQIGKGRCQVYTLLHDQICFDRDALAFQDTVGSLDGTYIGHGNHIELTTRDTVGVHRKVIADGGIRQPHTGGISIHVDGVSSRGECDI